MQKLDARCDTYSLIAALGRHWAVICIALGLVLGVTYLTLGQMPRSYEASATILVEPRQTDKLANLGGTVDGARVASLVQLLRSRDTMAMVVDRAGLSAVAEFGGNYEVPRARHEAIEQLSDRIVVIAGDDNAIIYVRGRSNSPELARQLTLAVAEAALERRVAMVADDIGQTAEWLGQANADLQASVAAADGAVADYMGRHDIVRGPGETTLDEQQMATLQTQITAARLRSLQFSSRADLWRQHQATGGAMLTNVLDEAGSRDLLQEYAALQASIAGLSSQFSSAHPALRAAQERAAELKLRLDQVATTAIRDAEGQAAAENALVVALQAELADAQAALIRQISTDPELDALRREVAAQRAVLERYQGLYESAITTDRPGAILPDMRIISHPRVPVSPISPKSGLVLGAVFLVAAMAILVALIVGLQSRRRTISA